MEEVSNHVTTRRFFFFTSYKEKLEIWFALLFACSSSFLLPTLHPTSTSPFCHHGNGPTMLQAAQFEMLPVA
jgi:hypothetical protein